MARKREALSTQFSCLFCNHENCVTVELRKKEAVGSLRCKICDQRFDTNITYLSAAIDVYSDWIDACDAVARTDGNSQLQKATIGHTRDDEDDEDDF